MIGFEGCFELILKKHSDLVVANLHIKFGEICGASQFIQDFVYYGHRESIFDGQIIQLPIVNAKPPCAVLFLD